MILLFAVNYKSANLAPRLVASLKEQIEQNWRLWLIDNSESPKQYKELQEAAKSDARVDVVSSGANLGYMNALAFGRALPQVARDRADFVILMNMDVRLSNPDTLTSVLRHKDRTGLGVLAPSIYSCANGSDQNPFMTKRPRRRDMAIRRLLFGSGLSTASYVWLSSAARRLARKRSHIHSENPINGDRILPIYAPHGACIVFAREYFARGGRDKHGTWLFNEELTVAEECRRLGLQVLYDPRIRFSHLEHASTGRRVLGGVVRSRAIAKAQSDAAKYAWHLLYGRNARKESD